jgi:hypothetical protein
MPPRTAARKALGERRIPQAARAKARTTFKAARVAPSATAGRVGAESRGRRAAWLPAVAART